MPAEKTQAVESDASFDYSNSVPAESTTLGKSAKGKSKKKEEDTKAQEETEKLQAIELENQRKLLQRIDDIKKLTKEQEALKNLYVTTPNALHISFLHHISIGHSDASVSKEATFLVRLENFAKESSCESSAKRGMVSELHRCIMEDGLVVQVIILIIYFVSISK